MNQTKNSTIQLDINGLRGLSVLMVVLFHFNIKIFSGGFIGVDLFFVISGFLMTKIIVSDIRKSKFNYFEFVFRRAKRIFPALFFLIFILFLLALVFLPPIDLIDLGKQIQQALVFNSNNYFAGQNGYFSGDVDNRWLLHTWSLAVEWQFYMLYPLILWIFFYVEKFLHVNQRFRLPQSLLLLTFFASLLYCIIGSANSSFYSIYSRAWQMIAGGIVYFLLLEKLNVRKYSAFFSYIGVAGIIASLYVTRKYGLGHLWPSYFAIAPILSICCILLASYENNIVLNLNVFQKLGSWSYSIYLWHWPIVIAMTITGFFDDFGFVAIILGLFLSVLFGYASYRWIEPNWSIKKQSKQTILAGIGVSFSVLFACSMLTSATDGLIMRTHDRELYRQIQLAKLPNTFEPSCENDGPANNKFCLINKQLEGRKILVIGDSHAGHLWPWFKKYSQVNTTFFVKSGCPVIPGFDRTDHSRWCAEYSEKAFQMAQSGIYDTVIISENWTTFYKESVETCMITRKACVPLREVLNPTPATDKIKSIFNLMFDKNIKVVVLDSTPYFNFRVPYKISRDMFWFGVEKNSFDVGDFIDKNIQWDELFHGMVGNKKFSVISLRPKLCKGARCEIFDGEIGMPIYIDGNHFNPAWIAVRGNIFQPYVLNN